MIRILFIIIYALIAWAIKDYNLTEKGIFLGINLVVFFFVDFYILKKVQFYKVFTTFITWVIFLVGLSIILYVLGIKADLTTDPLLTKNILISVFVLITYLSINYGATATYFRKKAPEKEFKEIYIVDTSAIIDGRFLDICRTGFLPPSMVIPEFVIREMQLIADSSIHEKRKKGRRGLNLLRRMKESDDLNVNILSTDYENLRGVDNKLLALAKEVNAKLITTDFNLVKVCEVEGVGVLNINKLATALKPQHVVGEKVKVHITKKGNSRHQGVGYLDDDSMVVIDDGEKFINQTKIGIVTAYIQTETGKMIFCKLA